MPITALSKKTQHSSKRKSCDWEMEIDERMIFQVLTKQIVVTKVIQLLHKSRMYTWTPGAVQSNQVNRIVDKTNEGKR